MFKYFFYFFSLDSVTKSHLTNALNILGSSRTSDYTIYDIRAAYLDLESAAEAGSMEAQKVLACWFFKLHFNFL